MKFTTIDQVQKKVGVLATPRDLKVINHVDKHAMRWLSYSRFAFLTFSKSGQVQMTLAGSEEVFVTARDATHLLIPLASLEDESSVKEGLSFGALFLVSGMGESLRVNGKVSQVADGVMTLEVHECYLHCAKAFRRSDFWSPKSTGQSYSDASHFIQHSRFLVLASINGKEQADVSPKGDPEKLLLQEEGNFICFADRPGNRRIDSFRNILEQPKVSMIALVPGSDEILEIKGVAELSDEEQLLTRFTIDGKKPKLITKIAPETMRILSSKVIARSALWQVKKAPEDLVAADIFKAHIKKSKESSLQAKVARAAVSLPGSFEKLLEFDYKNNMY